MDSQFDEDFRRDLLEQCYSTDFDGHTEFEKLSPIERLRWLSNTVFFIYSAAKNNPDLGCNDFFERSE